MPLNETEKLSLIDAMLRFQKEQAPLFKAIQNARFKINGFNSNQWMDAYTDLIRAIDDITSIQKEEIKPEAQNQKKATCWKDKTEEEKIEILRKATEASMRGDYETRYELMKEVPIPPKLARAIKNTFGLQALLNCGFNLSEVEKEFGKEWLES